MQCNALDFSYNTSLLASQVFMITKDPNPGLEGHVFPSPVDAEGYMVMLCYKNGSLTREGSVIVLIVWYVYSVFT
jgi:hypothetical protein